MKKFEIQIASVPDRENLVAEIWLGDDLICEINNENGHFEIEFYTEIVGKINYSVFLEILQKAKDKLLIS
ncbi:hypothetical protein SAMN02927921_04251 [Sinomicrobium oceani]|uniref:Uncharacterized protein n=1 Tax=Sinomicrobium oceani TaxID=1150368 RepID=A0A1K1RZM2_9FLAO|nr:hypothetical protein [Sinomicrobium oceani]SFW77624.1 hypothetical protein SAMN02927921_04251 [Sinomicrobium oceani]